MYEDTQECLSGVPSGAQGATSGALRDDVACLVPTRTVNSSIFPSSVKLHRGYFYILPISASAARPDLDWNDQAADLNHVQQWAIGVALPGFVSVTQEYLLHRSCNCTSGLMADPGTSSGDTAERNLHSR